MYRQWQWEVTGFVSTSGLGSPVRARVPMDTKRARMRDRFGRGRERHDLDSFLRRTADDPSRIGLRALLGARADSRRLILEDKLCDLLRGDASLARQDRHVVVTAGLDGDGRIAQFLRAHYGAQRIVDVTDVRSAGATIAVVGWDHRGRSARSGLLVHLGRLEHLERLIFYSPDATVTATELGRLDPNFHAARRTRVGNYYHFSLYE